MNEKTNKNKKPNSNLLTGLFASFVNGLRAKKAVKPKQYLEKKKLDYNKLAIGFNSGQFHHRKSENFRKPYIKECILVESKAPVNAPDRKAYTVFASYSLVFPLKNEKDEIVNYYATRIKLTHPESFYLNDYGVYPQYPNPHSKRLFLTHDIYDAATILQSGILKNEDSVLSLNDGELSDDCLGAISTLKLLDTIHVISKNERDEIKKQLKQISNAEICTILLPTAKSLNDVWCQGEVEEVYELLNKQSAENLVDIVQFDNKQEAPLSVPNEAFSVLHAQHFKFLSDIATYEVKGKLPKDLSSMSEY